MAFAAMTILDAFHKPDKPVYTQHAVALSSLSRKPRENVTLQTARGFAGALEGYEEKDGMQTNCGRREANSAQRTHTPPPLSSTHATIRALYISIELSKPLTLLLLWLGLGHMHDVNEREQGSGPGLVVFSPSLTSNSRHDDQLCNTLTLRRSILENISSTLAGI